MLPDYFKHKSFNYRYFLQKSLVLLCVFFSYTTSQASDRNFQSGDFKVLYGESSISLSGSIVIKINRFDAGNFIIDTLHMEYQDPLSFEWKEFGKIVHWKNTAGSNFYNSSPVNGEIVSFTDYSQSGRSGVDHFYVAEWTPKPELSNKSITIRARENSSVVTTASVKFYNVNAVRGMTVSLPEIYCDKNVIEWQAPDNVGDRTGDYRVFVNNSSSPVGTVSSSSVSSTSKNGIKKYKFEHYLLPTDKGDKTYQVHFKQPSTLGYDYYVPDANITATSKVITDNYFSVELTTKIKQSPVTPVDFAATTNRCDSIIKLSWSTQEADLDRFYLYYKEEGETVENVIGTFNGTDRSYDLKYPASATKPIEVRLRIGDDCPNSNLSTHTNIIKGDITHPMTAPSNLTTSTTSNSILLSWQDNSNNENEFKIIRRNNSSGITREYIVDENTITFEDTNIKPCELYEYNILAVNDCEEVSSVGISEKLTADLSQTFDLASFKTSKGYFSNKVKLEWDARNRNILAGIQVYRAKISNPTNKSLLATIDQNSSIWYDNNAEGGTLYSYSLKGFTFCGTDTVFSNEISQVGFRSPTGVVSGNVQFDGGFAVKDVAIRVANNNGLTGNSLLFDGINDSVSIPHKPNLMPLDSFTIELMIRPQDLTNDFQILSKEGTNTGYGLKYSSASSEVIFYVYDQTNALQSVKANSLLTINDYTQLTVVADKDSLYLYKNGVKAASNPLGSNIASNNKMLILGSNGSGLDYFKGNLDELRLWSKAKSSDEISRDFDRILNGAESDLIGYWSFDEGVGDRVYDFAHDDDNQIFYGNDGLISGAQWSTTIPSANQLILKAYTDVNGNYIINNIRFKGSGDNFNFTPYFGQHQFNPNTKLLYIGENSLIHNGIDFKDISSFRVTGTVNFHGTSCFLKGAFLYIDDQLAIKNGTAVSTDASGFFEISVPIGNHKVSVKKDKHYFNVGSFPTDGSLYYFNKPITGLRFTDSTLVKVAGRAVGGTREGNKKIGFGLSNNNIGKTSITFTSEQGSGCVTKSIMTNDTSGEYSIYLPPLRYIISNLDISKNPSVDFGTQSILDLTNFGSLKEEKETFGATDSSFFYHVKKNFIYRSSPNIDLTEIDGTEFLGEKEYDYVNPSTDVVSKINLTSKPFGYPIFTSDKLYYSKLSVFEPYVNKDSGTDILDKTPVTDAEVFITNNIGESDITAKFGGADYIKLKNQDGDTIYSFRTGAPNTFVNVSNPNLSFTSTIEVKVEIGEESYLWLPNGKSFRAYTFGAKAIGATFFTKGPELVTNILRDPPGNKSYAYIKKGTVSETINSWELKTKNKVGLVKTIKTGTKFSIGGGIIGPSIETEIEINGTSKTKAIANADASGSYKESVTVTEAWKTDSGPEQTGGASDLLIGKSQNFLFGASNNITIIPDKFSKQGGGTLVASDDLFVINGDSLRIGLKSGIYVLPQGFDTHFSYPVHHIERILIPNLETLRNNLFSQDPTKYISKILSSNPLFASNNDDVRWGNLPLSSDTIKRNGPSYEYKPSTIASDKAQMDSIRWYNQQIRLWEEALERNEKEKIQADFVRNISYTGSEISYSMNVAKDTTYSQSFEVGASEDLQTSIGASIGGAGLSVSTTLEMELTAGGSFSQASGASTEYGYVLDDDDHNDFFSLDIKKAKVGTAPIFKLIGGQTKCPWEGGKYTKYYEPGKHQISASTAHREVPIIDADRKVIIGIPEDEGAIFKLKLSNASEVNDTQWYGIRVVDDVSGVVFKLDGAPFSASPVVFEIKGNTTIEKELTIFKSGDNYKHDDIRIMFFSTCEWAAHTNGGDLVSTDTLKLGVEFVQACTDVNIKKPLDQWISNNSDSSKLKVQIDTYDHSNSILNQIELQYKPNTSSSWVTLNTFYKDTTNITDPNKQLLDTINGVSAVNWDQSQLIDNRYDLRAVSVCFQNNDYSALSSGVLDRVNPRAFGSPQPADGVLDPNDDILIQFNETVNAGKLTWDNFDIRGVLNGGKLTHQASLLFDGIDDYLRIPRGVNLFNTSFTVESWVKRLGTIEEAIFSQGNSKSVGLWYGFDTQGHFVVEINGQKLASDLTYTDKFWHHWAFSYDNASNRLSLFLDGKLLKSSIIKLNYRGNGTVYIGKRNYAPALNFSGNIHELRIWKEAKSSIELGRDMGITLTGLEEGLIGYWPIDEAEGDLILDKVHNRNAVHTATWIISPSGQSIMFDGVDDAIEIDASSVVFNEETDFTIECWFKADATSQNKTLFSNGKAELPVSNSSAWEIGFNAQGHVEVWNNGIKFIATDKSYLDNDWHHLALVIRRKANTTLYIDSNEQNSMSSDDWKYFGGPKWTIGARGWIDISAVKHFERYFKGQVDDFRVWQSARSKKQIQNYKNYRLTNDEVGLVAYLPFENYVMEASVLVLKPRLDDLSTNGLVAISLNGASFSSFTAPVKLDIPVEKVNFTYVVNDDKIFFDINESTQRTQNAILDVSVKNVEDLYSNKQQSAETWSVFVDQNQVKWEQKLYDIEKEVYQPYEWMVTVSNRGGKYEDFNINNLPVWLEAEPNTGTIAPRSNQVIKFKINEGLNIGYYTNDVYLKTSDYEEKLSLSVRVFEQEPNWEVNPNNYQYSMNIIGKLAIDDVISDDPNDMIGAFVNDTCRGVVHLSYISDYDASLAFLDIYSNQASEEQVEFRIWDADKGYVYYDVSPSIIFTEGNLLGTPDNPVIFSANNGFIQHISLLKGWKWVSFNLLNPQNMDVNHILSNIKAKNGDVLKNQIGFDQYYEGEGWIGSLSAEGGVKNTEMYMLKLSEPQDLQYSGKELDVETTPIIIKKGWNWLPYLPQTNLLVAEALSGLQPQKGSIVKGQKGFAIYDDKLGWIGSLKFMKPGEGYMYYSYSSYDFYYPSKGFLSSARTLAVDDSPYILLNSTTEPFTMGVIAKISELSNVQNLHLIAKNGKKVIGESSPLKMDGENLFFLSVSAKQLDSIGFALIDSKGNEMLTFENKFFFNPNAMVGSLEYPYELKTSEKEVFIENKAYPNPFDNKVTLDFQTDADGEVAISISDVTGKLIREIKFSDFKKGVHQFVWDGKSSKGNVVSEGIYFISINSPLKTQKYKVIKRFRK